MSQHDNPQPEVQHGTQPEGNPEVQHGTQPEGNPEVQHGTQPAPAAEGDTIGVVPVYAGGSPEPGEDAEPDADDDVDADADEPA